MARKKHPTLELARNLAVVTGRPLSEVDPRLMAFLQMYSDKPIRGILLISWNELDVEYGQGEVSLRVVLNKPIAGIPNRGLNYSPSLK